MKQKSVDMNKKTIKKQLRKLIPLADMRMSLYQTFYAS